MTGEEPKNILKYTMKYADTTYARQCTYMSLLKTYSCEICSLRTRGIHCYASASFVENKRCLSNGFKKIKQTAR